MRSAMPKFLLVCLLLLAASIDASAQNRTDGAERTLAGPANMTFGAVAGVAAGEPIKGQPRAALQLLLDATKDQKTGTVALG